MERSSSATSLISSDVPRASGSMPGHAHTAKVREEVRSDLAVPRRDLGGISAGSRGAIEQQRPAAHRVDVEEGVGLEGELDDAHHHGACPPKRLQIAQV